MGKNDSVPDAWDDDWESLADRAAKEEPSKSPEPEREVKMTKAERLAMHAEAQRKLWEAAESEKEINFLAATSSVPLTTPFKPAMKVLSRRPVIAKRDPVTGLERLTLQDDEDDDEDKNKKQETPEEIRMRQQRELEEKQRRYEEARAKIFGEASSSGLSTPGSITPPKETDKADRPRSDGQNHRRGRGRGGMHRTDSRPESQTRRLPTNSQSGPRGLFDPNYSGKPGSNGQRRSGEASPNLSRSNSRRDEDQVIRAPRGPDNSGRGGFGFARRGGQAG
ncbi:hypothetical protein SMAC4_02923 [Sordaria macrospora]|uniref:uncharacterized protein n=1 Tax=Sordaria macrospora TaxID=5147 RepID=UPI002B2AE57A|nr:hypothetical protein SMAC4_02923 [Sordaria macrospora]